MCLYTNMVLNPRYLPSKKNNYNPPICDDERKRYIPVACGNCIECRKKKQREWRVRMLEEIKHDKTGQFITLTFSEEHLEMIEKGIGLDGKKTNEDETKEANTVATRAVRKFLERWRKKYKKSVKHWLIVELGHNNTERVHLHGIIFTKKSKEEIEEIWKYGRIEVGYDMNERCVNYVMKYITKVDGDHPGFIGRILTSKGIGSKYITSYNAKKNKYVPRGTDERYKLNNGEKIGLPQYYRRKIYNDEEREELWIEKLNKEEMYVMGNKIDISTEKGKKELKTATEYARRKSVQRGYGGGEKKKIYLTKNNIENLDEERINHIFVEKKTKKQRYEENIKKLKKKNHESKRQSI